MAEGGQSIDTSVSCRKWRWVVDQDPSRLWHIRLDWPKGKIGFCPPGGPEYLMTVAEARTLAKDLLAGCDDKEREG